MRAVFPEGEGECIPVTIGEGPSQKGPRIGGLKPNGVAPSRMGGEYFGTICVSLDPVVDVSLFLFVGRDWFGCSGRLWPAEGSPIDVVVHGESVRGTDIESASTLSPHPLILGARTSDWIRDESGEKLVAPSHKLGGSPSLMHGEPALEREVNALLSSGVRQVLQMDFPGNGNDALVSGNWPFGDGLFHLLGTTGLDPKWFWFWEY